MTRKQLTQLILFLILPSVAFAHGEDILIPVYGQLAVLVASIIYISLYESKIKAKLLIIGVVLLSIIVAWALTGNMPFTKNIKFITTVDIALPLIGGLLAIAILKLKKRHKK